jgi:hypothetical protein
MLKTKTVFVVGAGASVDFGFPLGGQLKDRISSLAHIDFEYGRPSRGDPLIGEAAQIKANNFTHALEALIKAGDQIARAMPGAVSIDNFLHSREGDLDINLMGKLGIAKAILASERSSPLYVPSPHELARIKNGVDVFLIEDRPGFRTLPDSWLGKFAPLLCQGVLAQQLDRLFENVSFIIFNYDRCVEHYLWHHVQQYFGISEADASALLAKAHFHHPYGSVGALPWQTETAFRVRFGNEPSPKELLQVAAGIKTFNESVLDDDRGKFVEDLTESHRVLFLGFGFIEQNMQLLTLQKRGLIQNVYATAWEMSDDSCAAIEDSVREAFCLPGLTDSSEPRPVRVHANLKAPDIFHEYSLRLNR